MSTAMLPEMDCQELGLKRFRVVAFTGIEELSEAYCFSIDLRSEADTPVDALDLGRSLGKIATLVLKRPTGDERQIVGVITEATHLEMTSRHVQTWRIELRSPLWLLSLGRHYVVHAKKSSADIVKSLLDRTGLTCDLQNTSYQPEHTVQHGESDLDRSGDHRLNRESLGQHARSCEPPRRKDSRRKPRHQRPGDQREQQRRTPFIAFRCFTRRGRQDRIRLRRRRHPGQRWQGPGGSRHRRYPQ